MIRVPAPEGVITYRNDPYCLDLLPGKTIYDIAPATIEFHRRKSPTPDNQSLSDSCDESRTPGGRRTPNARSPNTRSPDCGRRTPEHVSRNQTPDHGRRSPVQAPLSAPPARETIFSSPVRPQPLQPTPSNVRYALINFKFGQASYVAPFKCSPGDKVVVEADGNTEHIGVIEAVTKEKPASAQPLMRILRHVRDSDLFAFEQCLIGEQPAMIACSELLAAARIQAAVLDLEWQLDKTAITVFVRFDAPQPDVKRLHELLVKKFVCRVFVLNAGDASTF